MHHPLSCDGLGIDCHAQNGPHCCDTAATLCQRNQVSGNAKLFDAFVLSVLTRTMGALLKGLDLPSRVRGRALLVSCIGELYIMSLSKGYHGMDKAQMVIVASVATGMSFFE